MRNEKKIKDLKKTYIIILIFFLIILSFLSLKYGNIKITFQDIFETIFYENFEYNSKAIILLEIRLPRIFMAIIVGGSLSVVGGVFQGIYKNPMADPFIIGTSSGAALGVSIALIFFSKFLSFFKFGLIGIFAFIGALLATTLSYLIAKEGKNIPVNNLLISGIAVNFLFSSIVSLIMIFNRSNIEDIILWLMGSFYMVSKNQLFYSYPIIIIMILIIYFYSNEMNMMIIGEDEARTMGVNVEKVKKTVVILSAVIISIVVANTGIIGFVGMMIPHISRYIIKTSDYKWNIPFMFLLGALLMIVSDAISRTVINNSEIPVGIITSILGSVYFIYLLYKNKSRRLK